MRYADHFLITEAQRKAQQFESEVERIQLLAQAPKAKNWRHHAAELLLQSAVRLDPQLKPRPTRSPC